MSALQEKLSRFWDQISQELESRVIVDRTLPAPEFIVYKGEAKSFTHSAAYDRENHVGKITLSYYYWDKMSRYQKTETMIHALAQIAVQAYFKTSKPHDENWKFIMKRMGYSGRVQFEGMLDK